ncbi:MAG: 50S ribosomal protein L19e [Candidatus Micrarchaeota archaeon]|nr:50S ribosomal protein L19e [Candidatus Micrarchaeota archaeon]
MSIRFAKRAASQIMNRGLNSIRIKGEALADAEKALTKDDIRALVKKGSIYAIEAKHNLSINSKLLKKARAAGRKRGIGRRRGTEKARTGRKWEKKVRSQRRLLKELKLAKKIDTKTFNTFYRLIKGNAYATKAQMLLHLKEHGLSLQDSELKAINDKISSEYK